MSDFQVILFVGQPPTEMVATELADEPGEAPNPEDSTLHVEQFLAQFQAESLLTPLHCPHLGADDSMIQPLLEQAIPDLICLFADDLEAQGEDVLAFCARLRGALVKHRPVLVVQTAAPEERRMEYLIQGADDSLSTGLSPEEFKIRLLVHLRRNLDFAANELTKLPNLPFATKVVQRRLNQGQPVALLLVELDHLDVYNEVYGELPTWQVLKTFAALLGRVVMVPDFISHTDENSFVIVTQPDRAEKIAALLSRQFETVAPNFYSDKERKQGYMISVISDNISRRVPLMKLSMGIASTQTQPVETFMTLFNSAQQMKTLAQMVPGHAWQSDRLRLAGGDTPVSGTTVSPAEPDRPGILVLESDAALAYLLKTTLEMEGYDVELASSSADARTVLHQRMTEHSLCLLVLDAVISGQETGLDLAAEARAQYPNLGIICASSLHNRQKILQAGADLYLPKPFELSNLFYWVARLLQEGRA